MVDTYLADNGLFNANAFINYIREHAQILHFCGVNANHHNGIVERAIKTVLDMSRASRAMMLHVSTYWKDEINSTLWPMATTHTIYIFNHMPDSTSIAPINLFARNQFQRHKLRDVHTWLCPIYAVGPMLQQQQKLPKWQTRS